MKKLSLLERRTMLMKVSVEDVDGLPKQQLQRGPGSQMEIPSDDLISENPGRRRDAGSHNLRNFSPGWSDTSNGSIGSNRGPVKLQVYVPSNASAREKEIHAFLTKMEIQAIDLKSTIESETRIECKSP